MFVPSNAGRTGPLPTFTVWTIAPSWSSFSRVFGRSVTQMFDPSNRMAKGFVKPVLTLVTDHGVAIAGLTIDTEPVPGPDPPFAVQILLPSKAIPAGKIPSALDTVVTGPPACVGSIMYRFPGLTLPVTNTRPIA